jgi:hypothetical protein
VQWSVRVFALGPFHWSAALGAEMFCRRHRLGPRIGTDFHRSGFACLSNTGPRGEGINGHAFTCPLYPEPFRSDLSGRAVACPDRSSIAPVRYNLNLMPLGTLAYAKEAT